MSYSSKCYLWVTLCEGLKWNGMLRQKQEKTKKLICRQGHIRFNSGDLINVGQRIQIIIKTPKMFWNDANPNNKPEQIIAYHNQWLYGFNFVRYQIKMINAIKFLIKEDKNNTKNKFSSKYPIEYNRIIKKAIKHANNYDLERMTNSNPYFDEGKENNNKELEDSKSAVEFRDSFDNNNGYMFLQINKDGTIDFDILNGYEDADDIIQRTAKGYIGLFYPEEKLNPTDKKERDNLVSELEKNKQVDCMAILKKFRTALKREARD